MDREPFSLMDFLFSFEGRIGRAGYWAYSVGAIAVMVPIILFLDILETPTTGSVSQGTSGDDPILTIILVIAVLGMYLWTNYAVHAKRWHDRGKSGWWSLIGFLPYIGGIWMLVECGFLRGTDGPNEYGDSPNAASVAAVFE